MDDIFKKFKYLGEDNAVGFIRKLPDVDISDSYDNTLLHIAARKGFKRVVKELIERGVTLNTHDGNNDFALDCAFPNLDLCIFMAKAGCSFTDCSNTDMQIRKLVDIIRGGE